MDIANSTTLELIAELDGAQKALEASLGNPSDGREETHKAKLIQLIAAIQMELERRTRK